MKEEDFEKAEETRDGLREAGISDEDMMNIDYLRGFRDGLMKADKEIKEALK